MGVMEVVDSSVSIARGGKTVLFVGMSAEKLDMDHDQIVKNCWMLKTIGKDGNVM